MCEWLKRLLGRSNEKKSTVVSDPTKECGIKVRCSSCGLEADESDFLAEDPDDTKCPVCGEDIPIYEL